MSYCISSRSIGSHRFGYCKAVYRIQVLTNHNLVGYHYRTHTATWFLKCCLKFCLRWLLRPLPVQRFLSSLTLYKCYLGGTQWEFRIRTHSKFFFFFSSPCPVRFLCGDSRTDSTGHLRHEWMQWRQSYNIDEGGVSNTTVKREVNLHCRSWQFPYEWGEVNYHTRYHNLEKKKPALIPQRTI